MSESAAEGQQVVISEEVYSRLVSDVKMAQIQLEDMVQSQLSESYGAAELAREDVGYLKLVGAGEPGLRRDHLVEQCTLHRVLVTVNPLIKRGVQLLSSYSTGQGVGTTAEGGDVNAVVQDLLDSPKGREVLFGGQALEELNTLFATDGNVFVAMVTEPSTGKTTPRMIPFEEIRDIWTAPGDRNSVQYYLREWTEYNPDTRTQDHKKALYPQLRYDPPIKHRTIDGLPVYWTAPVYHAKVNSQTFQKWGVGDIYAAVPWARAYKEFLEDWATLTKSLSKVAWAHTRMSYSEGSQRQRVAAFNSFDELEAGSSASMGPGDRLEAVPKSGATIDSESGRPLATMIAAAFGFPVTTLLSDPGQTGARAVAETLSLPTRLVIESRREVHREMRRQIMEYAILQAVKAPRNPLRGRVVREGDFTYAVTPDPKATTLKIDFPSIDDTPMETLVDALVKADSTGKIPPLVIVERILRALRVRDVDEILDTIKDADGNFIPPNLQAGAEAGRRAIDAVRRGEDPTQYL